MNRSMMWLLVRVEAKRAVICGCIRAVATVTLTLTLTRTLTRTLTLTVTAEGRHDDDDADHDACTGVAGSRMRAPR